MVQRIKFQGEDATCGECKSCRLFLVVGDVRPDGSFVTYHEEPMCEWYMNECKGAEHIDKKLYHGTETVGAGIVFEKVDKEA